MKCAKLHKKHKICKVSFQIVACLSSHYSSSWGKKKKKKVLNRQLEVKLMACEVAHLGGFSPDHFCSPFPSAVPRASVLCRWRGRSNGEKGWPSPPSVTSGAVPNDPGIRGSPADGDCWGPVERWGVICS